IVSLSNSEITLQSCVVTLSTTTPFLLFFLRYVNFIEISSNLQFFIDQICMEESLLQDLVETQILTKFIEDGNQVFGTCSTGIITFTSYLLGPIILDLIIPLNESRTRLLKYITEFSHDRTVYLDIVTFNFVFVATVGLLCIICTESLLTIFAHYLSGLFKITSYRLRKAVINLSKVNPLSQQVELNSLDFRQAVDIHNRAIVL
ncbi:unnamed protein product, partial [Heterotrigona itama]